MKVHNTTVLALLTFLILSNLAGQADAQAHYNCGSVSANHCYGVAAWSQGGEFFGTYADITITAMDGGDGFLDNEMWLVDNQSSGCKANSYGRCWEEVGYINQNNGTSGEVYFWADARPRNDSTFNVHILGT